MISQASRISIFTNSLPRGIKQKKYRLTTRGLKSLKGYTNETYGVNIRAFPPALAAVP